MQKYFFFVAFSCVIFGVFLFLTKFIEEGAFVFCTMLLASGSQEFFSIVPIYWKQMKMCQDRYAIEYARLREWTWIVGEYITIPGSQDLEGAITVGAKKHENSLWREKEDLKKIYLESVWFALLLLSLVIEFVISLLSIDCNKNFSIWLASHHYNVEALQILLISIIFFRLIVLFALSSLMRRVLLPQQKFYLENCESLQKLLVDDLNKEFKKNGKPEITSLAQSVRFSAKSEDVFDKIMKLYAAFQQSKQSFQYYDKAVTICSTQKKLCVYIIFILLLILFKPLFL